MVILSWLRFALGVIFLLIGMFLFGIQIQKQDIHYLR